MVGVTFLESSVGGQQTPPQNLLLVVMVVCAFFLPTFVTLITGRIRFRRARVQTPSSVSVWALIEFQGESSVSSSQPITHRAFRRTHRVCRRNQ